MRTAKELLFLVVLLGTAFTCGCVENPKASYINRKMKIAFDPPAGWIKQENPYFADKRVSAIEAISFGFERGAGKANEQQIVHFYNKEGKDSASILIAIAPILPGEEDLEKGVNKIIEGLKSQYSDFEVILKKSRIIDSLQGYEFSFKGIRRGVGIRQKQVLIKRGKLVYFMICTSLADSWSSLEPTFEKSIDSFRFIH